MVLGTTYVLPHRFDPEATLRAVAAHRCTSLAIVPIMMQRMLALPDEVKRRYDLSSLHITAASGSAMPGHLATEWMDAFGDNLYNFYGSTEVAMATVATPEDLRFFFDDLAPNSKRQSVAASALVECGHQAGRSGGAPPTKNILQNEASRVVGDAGAADFGESEGRIPHERAVGKYPEVIVLAFGKCPGAHRLTLFVRMPPLRLQAQLFGFGGESFDRKRAKEGVQRIRNLVS